jgi:hypothetical protein
MIAEIVNTTAGQFLVMLGLSVIGSLMIAALLMIVSIISDKITRMRAERILAEKCCEEYLKAVEEKVRVEKCYEEYQKSLRPIKKKRRIK